MEPAVLFEDVSFAYENKPVLEHVHLCIETGQFASIAGPNGGGKSTLFRLILGLLKPQHGQIRVFGQSPEQARPQLGYVPQDFVFDRRFPVRVVDVVRMGCLGSGVKWTQRRGLERNRVDEALDAVGMAALKTQWFSRLSGGQRQRVLIARALATSPDLLLLDEPTASIDAAAEEEILSLLERLRGRLTVLLVTHSASVASRFLETIVCVNHFVHLHPTVTTVDDTLMRHICGYEPLSPSAAGGR